MHTSIMFSKAEKQLAMNLSNQEIQRIREFKR